MKLKSAILLFITMVCAVGCSTNYFDECENDVEVITLATTPANVQTVIFLVNQNTGETACCRDTATSTAEECAFALEKECFKRVEDIPYGTASYDVLKSGTYPTRRWRNGEQTPRW